MTNDEALAWIGRRLTFGGTAAHGASWVGLDADSALERLIRPDGAGVAVADDPFAELEVPAELSVEAVVPIAQAWLDHLITTTRPAEARLAWFWHDYFAVAANQVRALYTFIGHLGLLQAHALGNYAQLLRQVTTDPAMLVFLDGIRNARGSINENYGRELLELYSLGVGNYTEADVRAAAVALSGWVWRPELDESLFLPLRHDPTPQTLLGKTVADVDDVIAAVTSHPACGRHVAGRLAEFLLGVRPDPATVHRLGADFLGSGHDVAGLALAIVELGLDGLTEPIVMSPIEWLLQVEALTGAGLPESRQRLFLLRQMGQVPGVPPDVGGYPGADTWAGPSATVGRFRAASVYASRTDDDAPVLGASRRRDWDEVAHLAGRPEGFSAQTMAALSEADTTRRGGREALAAVLMSPEMVIA